MFKIDIFKHQKCSTYFISIFCTILKIIALILNNVNDFERPKVPPEGSEPPDEKGPPPIEENNNFIYKGNIPVIIFGLLIYLFIITIRSYSNCKIKWHFDVNYIPKGKLLMFYGLIGTIICVISCIITTFIDCNKTWCRVRDKENNLMYYDSFKIYFKYLFNSRISTIFLNILLILFFGTSFFFKSYFFVLVIKHLTPVHIIGLSSIHYFIVELILGIITIYNYDTTEQKKRGLTLPSALAQMEEINDLLLQKVLMMII